MPHGHQARGARVRCLPSLRNFIMSLDPRRQPEDKVWLPARFPVFHGQVLGHVTGYQQWVLSEPASCSQYVRYFSP
jgi:hypothetical protein